MTLGLVFRRKSMTLGLVSYESQEIKLLGGSFLKPRSAKNLLPASLVRKEFGGHSDEKKNFLLLSETKSLNSST